MSRKLPIVAAGGLFAVVATVGLWPNFEKVAPQDAVAPSPTTTFADTPNQIPVTEVSPHNGSAGSVATEANPPGDALSDFGVFGEAVNFMPGDLCDTSGDCRREPVALHEYAEYTDDQLRTLSAFDGTAAIVLANRLGASEPAEARRFAARGFVLTADPYAFHMTQQFSGVASGAVLGPKGEIDLAAARRAYLWVKLGYELGVTDAARLDYQAAILTEHGMDDLSALDAAAAKQRQQLEDARLHLVGEGFK